MTSPLDAEFWTNEERLFWEAIALVFIDSAMDAVMGAASLLPEGLEILIDFDFVNQAVIDYAKQYQYEWISKINDTTRQQVQNIISDWVQSGNPLSALESQLTPLFGPIRAEMIASTEVTRIFAEVNQKAFESTGFVGGKQWNTVRDERVCPICSPLDGEIVPIKSQFYSEGTFYEHPPAHPRCLPGNSLVLPIGRVSAGSKRWYQGDMVTIHTLKNNLTVTPNHPILTKRGWIPAGQINKFDNVFQYRPTQGINPFIQINNNNIISSVKDIFSSLNVNGFRVPVSPPDFHNDGGGSNIAVIRPNSFVMNNSEAFGNQPFAQLDFIGRNIIGNVAFPRFCSHGKLFKTNFSSLDRSMGRTNLFSPLTLAHLAPFDRFRFGLSSWGDTIVNQTLAKRGTIDPRFFSQLIFGFSGNITSEKVIKVENFNFSGYVYNLQSESGLYVADGIITHNCRCWIQPIVDVEQALAKVERILNE